MNDDYQFLLIFNKKHHENKRPAQYKKIEDMSQFSLETPFDDSKFNFTKTSDEEDLARTTDAVVKVNISPIFETHSLFLPKMLEKLP